MAFSKEKTQHGKVFKERSMILMYVFEPTKIEEKETIIRIDKQSHIIELCTQDASVYRKIRKRLQEEPFEVYKPVNNKYKGKKEYISGCSYKYNYILERNKALTLTMASILMPIDKKKVQDTVV